MQRYTEIPSSKTLAESLPLILNNDKTGMSCSSGTAFPTTNLIDGMLCHRTDQKKLYQLVDTANKTWRVVADLSGDARNLDGGAGNAIAYDKRNLNTWADMPTGFYEGSNMLNAPTGDTYWRVIQIRQGNSNGYSTQLAFGANGGKMCVRYQKGGQWSAWVNVYTGTDGKVVTGLNADKVDGKEPGNASGQIPLNNSTLNVNLNADMVDGKHVGNASGQIPLNDGRLMSGLNADRVDGYHAGNASGQIPVSNGKLNKNLNAELLNGMRGSDFVVKNSTNEISGVNGLSATNINSTTIQTTNLGVSGTLNGKAITTDGGVVKGENKGYWFSGSNEPEFETYGYRDSYGGSELRIKTIKGIGASTLSLKDALQRLITISHRHESVHYSWRESRCDCN